MKVLVMRDDLKYCWFIRENCINEIRIEEIIFIFVWMLLEFVCSVEVVFCVVIVVIVDKCLKFCIRFIISFDYIWKFNKLWKIVVYLVIFVILFGK